MVADWLARNCCSGTNTLCHLDMPNLHVWKLLLEDKFGLPYVRT